MANIQQIIIIGGINCVSLSNGFIYGQIASMVRALKNKEEDISLTEGQISFIASFVVTVSICGLGLAAVVSDIFGRRWSFIIFSIPVTLNWIILYYARDLLMFTLSRILAGISMGALIALKMCITSEYSSPNKRALFLSMISALSPAIGCAVAHALGILLHWRIVALIGILPAAVNLVLPYFWIESPHWLASKGRFDECEVAFRRLHGSALKSETELQLLIKLETTKLKKAEETNSIQTLKKLLLAFRKRFFWDLMLLSIFIDAYLAAVGKYSFNVFALNIIEDITGSRSVLLFTSIVDGFTVAGAGVSCYLATKMSMRNKLFTTGIIAISVLLALSACLYFNNGSEYSGWINIFLVAFYFFIVKAGPYPVLDSLNGEIFPIELKVYCFFFSGIVLMCSYSLSIVLLPILVNVMGYSGLFLLNASIMSLSLCYIWLKLPETKGKTLQEIEIYFKTKTCDNVDKALSSDQIKALI